MLTNPKATNVMTGGFLKYSGDGFQKVQNEAGHVVQVADRFYVEYLKPNLRAVVNVDFGVHVDVYKDSLHFYDDMLHSLQLTEGKRKQ